MRYLCIGECMVEMAPQADPGSYRMGYAGDTLNTAWYLRQLMPDARVGYLTAVGQDAVSDAMLAFLAGAGIDTAHVQRRGDRTVGLYLIQLTGAERSFAYWRGQSAARTLAQDAGVLDAALTGADVAYLSGITLAILADADRARLLDRLGAWRAGGGRVVFDPNLRPRLWDDTATMCRAVMQAAAVSDTVLPSYDDEAAWFGDTDPAATAARYAAADVTEVVVKNGDGPMLALCDGTTVTVTPPPVARVVDTTAAGDSFNAGYMAARAGGADPAAALAAGAALAGRVIGTRGALLHLDG
ncbi:2-dehydro-3-deoxygluconokinase [Loktanella fryxellensis]|uniref:2-dehydro-3-deoxygluconokinase n=1 Tax=Loktanella fryxellensis TaxID=245187 RepID=A0A1H8GMM1_9RHOB|nr:sugar kinase [Loktanella fryxellensis]SEN45069.1 2-dehydro-3-deoxygluconokinase [Loktanella fryxellensis]